MKDKTEQVLGWYGSFALSISIALFVLVLGTVEALAREPWC